MFQICTEHRVDNIEVFFLLLSRTYTDPRPFLTAMLIRRLRVHQELGWDTDRTGDYN